jgi:hypothetical protein
MAMTIHQCLTLLGSITKLASYEDSGNHRAKVEAAMQANRGMENMIHSTPEHW